ncbi:MAG: alpha/beta hydrolase, partial [Pseudomonadota bacterium]
ATDDTPLDVDGLILSAPAVWGGRHMNSFYRLTLWLTSTIAPGWTLSPSGLDIWPSDNIEMLRAFSADPLVIKVTRTDAIAGLVNLMDKALAAAPELEQEILLLAGDKDQIVPTGAIDDFASRLNPTTMTTIRYPDGFHMLLRDLQRDNVYADIDAWIDRGRADR